MQGYVREKLIEDFKTQLPEDAVVLIKGCGVGVQNDKFPVLDCTKKIIFYKSTEVLPTVGWNGHPYGFHFKKLEAVEESMMGKGVTVDIIGNISWCGNMDCFKSTTGKDTKRLHLDLQNLENHCVQSYNVFHFLREVVNKVPDYGHSDAVVDDRAMIKRKKAVTDEMNDSDEELKRNRMGGF